MGNYRFRLSDMMPNAWFYKLKDMSKSRNQNPSHPINKKLPLPTQGPRNSLYHTTESISVDRLHNSPANPKAFDTHFPHDPPRKSSKKRTKRKTIYKPSPRRITPSAASAGRICPEPGNPAWIKPETVLVQECFESTGSCHTSPDQQDFLESISSEFEYSDSFDALHQWMDEGPASWPSSCSCSLSSSASDIIIDMNETRYNTKKIDKVEFDMVSEPDLPPILTRPRKHNALQESPEFKNSSVKFQTEKHRTQKKKNTKTATSPATRKSFSHSGGVKIQGNKAKLGSKKIDTRGRKSLKGEKKGWFYSESFAIVKASFDPEKDFRDSMMEMIVENNIRASKDLEELLACYLSLNSSQYHDLIIKAFEQIWFNMPQSHL